MKFLSFKIKILGIIIISSIAFAYGISVLLDVGLKNFLINTRLENVTKLNDVQADKITKVFEKYQLLTSLLSETHHIVEYTLNQTPGNRSEVLNVLDEYHVSDYEMAFIVNKEGRVVFSTNPDAVGQDNSFREFYKQGINGRPYVDMLLGKVTNKFGYYFSEPIFGAHKEVIGIFVLKVGISKINKEIITSYSTDNNNSVMLVDQYGIVLESNRPERVLKSLGAMTPEQKEALVLSKKYFDYKIDPLPYNSVQMAIASNNYLDPISFYDDLDNDSEFMNIKKIGDLPFFIVTETGVNDIEDAMSYLVTIWVDILLLGVILAVGLIYLLISYLLNPLKELEKYAQTISKGDFSQKIKVKSNDEIGRVAGAFNKMTEELKSIYRNQEVVISERTEGLRLKSEESEKQKQALLNILEDFEIQRAENQSLLNRVDMATHAGKIAVWEWDIVNDHISWDSQMYNLFGLKRDASNKPITRDMWQNMVHPDDRKARDESMQLALLGKKPYDLTFRVMWPNGEIHYIRAFGNVERDAAGNPVKVVGIDFDVTAEKETDQAKTEFVSLASHQLKTPIGSLSWNLEMLKNGDYGKLNKGQKEVLDDMYKMNQRMNDLINSLLNISRLDMGVFIVEPELIDWGDICDEVLRELDSRIKNKKHKISKKYDRNISNIPADPKLLRVIFQNYISNAVKYTPNNGKISISIENKNGRVIISVSNNGEPIPDSDKDKIFDKLFRASNAQAQDPDGNGLGLYMVKKIIENSGGQAWFESEKGKDTVFYASFPATGMIERKKPIKS